MTAVRDQRGEEGAAAAGAGAAGAAVAAGAAAARGTAGAGGSPAGGQPAGELVGEEVARQLVSRGAGKVEPGELVGEEVARRFASKGTMKVDPGPSGSKPPWLGAGKQGIKTKLGSKVALAIVGAVTVAGVGLTGTFVLAGSGKKSDDEASIAAQGSDKADGEEGDESERPSRRGREKAPPGSSTTVSTTTTLASTDPASSGGPVVTGGGPGTTGTTPTTAPATTTTTTPRQPAPEIVRFIADFDNSGTVRCANNMLPFLFRWTSSNTTTSTLTRIAGGANVTGLPAEGSRVACGLMDEEWKLTATGPGGTDTATVRTRYFG